MEESFLDEMYGNLGSKHCDSSVVHDEDSVDIYSGLDHSPENSKNSENTSAPILSQKLKDSMDLYEEIITEEQQERQATYNELKVKLDEAENKVKELIWKLHQVQTQNKKMLNENMQLKKNISALIKTAKLEIARKTEEINRLNQRSGRFGGGPPFPRSQLNFKRHELTRPNPTGTCDLNTLVQEHRVNHAQRSFPQLSQKDANGLIRQPDAEAVDVSPLTSLALHRAKGVDTDIDPSSKSANFVHVSSSRDSRILRPTGREGQISSDRQCTRNDDRLPKTTVMQEPVFPKKDGKRQSTEKRDQHNCDESGVNNDSKVKDGGGLNTDHREEGQEYIKQHSADFLRKSERVHSPPRQTRPRPMADASHQRLSSSHMSKGRHKDSREAEPRSSQERRRSHDQNGLDRVFPEPGKDRKQRGSNHVGVEDRSSSSSRRRAERSPPRDQRHREKKSSGNEESRCRREASSRMGMSKDRESRRRESNKSERDSIKKRDDLESGNRENFKNDKQATLSNAPCTKSKSAGHASQDKCSTSTSQRQQVKRSRVSRVMENDDGEKVLDESTQDNKLSFMETLNLTLSPVKKPKLSSEGSDRKTMASEDGHEECDDFNFGEDFCVIDEVDGSHETFQEKELNPLEEASVSPVVEDARQSPKLGNENSAEGPRQDSDKSELTDNLIFESEEARHSANTELEKSKDKFPAPSTNQVSQATPVEKNNSDEKCVISKVKDIDGAEKTTIVPQLQDISFEKHLQTASLCEVIVSIDAQGISKSETCDSSCETPCAESALAMTQDSVNICMTSAIKPSDHATLKNTPLPAQVTATSENVSGHLTMETYPDSAVLREKDCDICTDAVSSTVGMPPETCRAENTPSITEAIVISSTESESIVTNSPSKDHTSVLSGISRSSKIKPVSEHEVGSSIPSPKDSSEPNSTENEDQDPVPSSSLLFHDEDSMMLTLKSVQFFPNAISPLTSPIRPVKSQAVPSGKAPHVRSLNKEFSSVTVTISTSARRMDVNKENEKPDCSSTETSQKDQSPPATSSISSSNSTEDENELEEGEIVSDSEDDHPAAGTPPQDKATSVMASNNRCGLRSPRLAEKEAQKAPVVLAGDSGTGEKSMLGKTHKRTLSTKKPFKTIVPLLPKTNPSTVPEVMDMLKQIRTLMRKKYMKLHKTFPKKSFYNIIDMSRFSFTDFVNNMNFSKLGNMEDNLKPKLNNIISVCMNKISNNGIVKRIFEQQSPSLKKKLWTFVEGQFDFLFKEIKVALLSLSKPTVATHLSMSKNNFEKPKEKMLPDTTAKSSITSVASRKQEKTKIEELLGKKSVLPHQTGLGSKGKNLRMTMCEEDKVPERKRHDAQSIHHSAVKASNDGSSPEKTPACISRISHNASLQDKSDFEILTEQQTSSLTFNLVTDSQMGEIFKCLLQGSDLLENSISAGDSNNWSVSTPRKDLTCGESFVGMITPSKAATPSKLIASWSDISPCKFSPNSKIRFPLNPAVLDESCMLEVPSSLPFDRVTPSSAIISQRSYSILTEDLAVSLTIPSPLKSDSHLSFLQSVNEEPASAPDSVISAHFSEDALLDGEDATEQDIHLALDSDNTSSESSVGGVSEEATTSPVFQFKPHVPMQAVVMEKSNDHFIVRIRHASTGFVPTASHDPVGLVEEQVTCAEEREVVKGVMPPTSDLTSVDEQSQTLACRSLAVVQPPDKNDICCAGGEHPLRAAVKEPAGREAEPLVARHGPAVEDNEGIHAKNKGKAGNVDRKRKRHRPDSKAKRTRSDATWEGNLKPRRKKSKNMKNEMTPPKEKRSSSASSPLTPNSLSAKNVVRKKGEVVVTWTREEDRDILIELKMNGASLQTFSALSAKINKSPTQIEERFSQLMKLFKKKEKMKSCTV